MTESTDNSGVDVGQVLDFLENEFPGLQLSQVWPPPAEVLLQFPDPSVSFPHIDTDCQQFRILHLRPSSTRDNIVCDLSVASLENPPAYEALSYVWGNKYDPPTITVNNSAFKITRNLYMALANMIPTGDSARAIWVDAICINQGNKSADLKERRSQVNLMGRIYSGAVSVTAYLGDPFFGLDLVLRYLAQAAREPDSHVDPNLHPHLSVSGMDSTSVDLSNALITFFNRPWWHRVWTVQEYTLGRKVVFQFAKVRYPAAVASAGVAILAHHQYKGCCDTKAFEVAYNRHGKKYSAWTVMSRIIWLNTADSTSPFQGLTHVLDRRCRDPRDKIYALLGIFPGLGNIIEPDYEVAPQQLFKKVALAWAGQERDLGFLGYLAGPLSSRPRGLPTWALDWSLEPRSDTQTAIGLKERSFFQPRRYTTCRGTSPCWTPNNDPPDCVTINGFLFDIVKPVSVVPRLQLDKSDSAERYEWLGTVLRAALEKGTAYGSVEQRNLAFLRTLCGDMSWKGDIGYVRFEVEAMESKLKQWWEEAFKPQPRDPALSVPDIHSAVISATTERSFITTDKGYFGLAHSDSQDGDMVAILGGGRAPIILRPKYRLATLVEASTSLFHVVGDAYIHGIMDGEAFAICSKEEADDKMGTLVLT